MSQVLIDDQPSTSAGGEVSPSSAQVSEQMVIELRDVTKVYSTGPVKVVALDHASLKVAAGDFVAIMGPSGSGKSTLMNLVGLLDRPTEGTLEIDGEPIALTMADGKLAELRSAKIGFVFQSFNLFPRLSALANVLLPTAYTP